MCARVRAAHGAGHAIGAKALVVQASKKDRMRMLVLPGNRKLNSRAVREALGAFRFATPPELAEATGGLIPGTVPPFLLPTMPGISTLHIDTALCDPIALGFNAASLTQSVVMSTPEHFRWIGETAAMPSFSSN